MILHRKQELEMLITETRNKIAAVSTDIQSMNYRGSYYDKSFTKDLLRYINALLAYQNEYSGLRNSKKDS